MLLITLQTFTLLAFTIWNALWKGLTLKKLNGQSRYSSTPHYFCMAARNSALFCIYNMKCTFEGSDPQEICISSAFNFVYSWRGKTYYIYCSTGAYQVMLARGLVIRVFDIETTVC